MTVYKGQLSGEDKPRYVKATTKKEAQDHFVNLTALKADEVEELIGTDVKIERPGQPADPAPATSESE